MSDHCPTPYKLKFPQRAEATAAVLRQRGTQGRVAVKVYRCECGYWHVAGPKRPVSDENRKRNHRRKGGRHTNQLRHGKRTRR